MPRVEQLPGRAGLRPRRTWMVLLCASAVVVLASTFIPATMSSGAGRCAIGLSPRACGAPPGMSRPAGPYGRLWYTR
jgi:hypothetical protein